MERHYQCQSVSENAKELSNHLSEHNQLPTCAQDKAECFPGGRQPQVSDRPNRKVKSNPALPGNGNKEKLERDGPNQEQKGEAVERDSPPPVDSSPLKAKEYVAEGAEHIYRTHTCPTCRRCFKMRSHLQEHLNLHFPDPSLQCPTCKRHFTSKSKLRIHRLREAGEKVHRCHLCEYSAVERNAIRRHLASMHTDETQDDARSQSYPCPTCGQSFRQSRSLKAHMKTHNIQTASTPVACFQESCSFQSSVRKELLRHTFEVHGVKAVECRHYACAAIFQTETDMEIHYRTHVAYHCSQCDFSSSNKTLFLQHQRLGHAGVDELCCDFCPFATFNPVEFEQHVGHLHANEKIHHCPQCSYVTSHKRGLKRHMLMHSGDKPHKCSLCDFRCRDESYLSRHMLTHSEDKNFMCAECGYVTKWKHYLNVHMRKHAGDLRYQCDQCPYRCYRMDQLNSHKLRHQDKSLICEICAYACKRKYELRNHMLAKHSGEERQPSAFKCKYCAYTTCYRQALQNHENCKHTRLKEFRCALCVYSSFSGISLFLHKKKAHGYVPGDKAWLENYAAKERERNSTEFEKDFYNQRSAAESNEQPVTSRGEQCGLPGAREDPVSGSQNVDALSVLDEVPQESVDKGISDTPEEYCTLILTTLSTTDYQPCANRTAAQEKAVVLAATSPSGEDDVEMSNEECDLDDGNKPLNNSTSQTEEPKKCLTPEGESDDDDDDVTIGSILPTGDNQPSDFEVRLKALKKHDKDQAEAMVLEGRVQMLVVPTKDAYRCDKCSYVTLEEADLKHHSQALCRGKTEEHKCQACGAQFKQRRGLDSHLLKKCPALPRNTRTFVGISKICQPPEEKSSQGEEGSRKLPERTSSVEPELLPPNLISTDSHDHVPRQEQEVDPTSPGLKHQRGKTRRDIVVKKRFASLNKGRRMSLKKKSLYTQAAGKFKCRLCHFASIRLTTVERHLATFHKESRSSEAADGQCDNESVAEKEDNRKTQAKTFCAQKSASLDGRKKRERTKLKKTFDAANPKDLSCLLCAFTCKQKRRMAQHVALKHKGVRPHRCKFCPFATTRRYRLEEHQSLHTGIGRHECQVCDKTFGTVAKLRQHKTRIHDKRPAHFCSACDFSGYTLDDVRRHNFRCHTGDLKHACAECDACFSSESALRNHRKRAHQLPVCFRCRECDYTCSSEATLKTHQQSKHRQVKCATCQEAFLTKESLEVHQRSHLAHRCELCPFATKTRQQLAQHLGREHEEGSAEDKPLRCSTCRFACRHQLVLEQHLRSHGGRRLYKCTDCEYSTRNKQKITWHIRVHTGEKPYSCELCSYTCSDPSRLKLHMRVHQEEKKYLCPECGYKCKWASQLKCHMTKHTGEKPHACDECDYRTNRADALRAHRDTQHCDVRPYVCEKCGKAFKTSFILKTHQRQHSDDRAYACGLCHKAFRWPAGLRHHYLSHTKQQPFRCRHCAYRAKQKFQVVKHLQRHHPEMSAEGGVVRDSDAVSLTLKEALQGTLDERTSEVEEEGEGGR